MLPIFASALTVLVLVVGLGTAQANDGLVVKKSSHGVAETIDRLEAALEAKGIMIFGRVDHAAGAAKADLQLRPTMLLIFGNPQLGTPLMQSSQTVGLDLPMKALAYEDASGQVFLVYSSPRHLAERHGIEDRDEVIGKIENALNSFADAATK